MKRVIEPHVFGPKWPPAKVRGTRKHLNPGIQIFLIVKKLNACSSMLSRVPKKGIW